MNRSRPISWRRSRCAARHARPSSTSRPTWRRCRPRAGTWTWPPPDTTKAAALPSRPPPAPHAGPDSVESSPRPGCTAILRFQAPGVQYLRTPLVRVRTGAVARECRRNGEQGDDDGSEDARDDESDVPGTGHACHLHGPRRLDASGLATGCRDARLVPCESQVLLNKRPAARALQPLLRSEPRYDADASPPG